MTPLCIGKIVSSNMGRKHQSKKRKIDALTLAVNNAVRDMEAADALLNLSHDLLKEDLTKCFADLSLQKTLAERIEDLNFL